MTERRCGTCRWHDVDGFYRHHGSDAEGLGDVGFCRAQLPLPAFVHLWYMWKKAEQQDDLPDKFVWAVWPETHEDDWCRAWEAREDPPTP
jgi:hypothetical protein